MKLKTPHGCRLVVTLSLLVSAAACLPAAAGDPPAVDSPSTTVKFVDLDLNTDAGRRALLARLSLAATRVCERDAFLHGDIGYPMVYGSCHDLALAKAVDKIHQQELSALFSVNSHRNPR